MARQKREYENEIPDFVDLDEHKDYSVLLAGADKVRADAAVAVAKYQQYMAQQARVTSINDRLRTALNVA